MPEGGESPPPERLTGAQQQTPAGSGKGTGNPANQDKDALKSQLDNLESNPKGPLDDQVKEKFSKESK